MYRLTASILDVINSFHNKNVTINERICGISPPYYIYWFEISYPNVPLDQDYGPFCLQFMNGIQLTKPAGRQWNRIIDAVVTTIRYNKITTDHDIYIKVFSAGTVSYLKFSNDDIINTTKNETVFPELTKVSEEHFEIKFQ